MPFDEPVHHADKPDRNSVRVPAFIAVAAVLLVGFFIRFQRSDAVPEVLPMKSLVRHGDRLFRIDATQPFTGRMEDHYPDGSLRARVTLREGVLDGLAEGWHTNGVLQVVEFFRAGIAHGPRTNWYASGARMSEANVVDGKMDGLFRRWHENGQLSEEFHLQAGEPAGEARAWYPSGYLRAYRGTNSAGQVEQMTWKDLECRAWPELPPSSPAQP